MKIPYTKYFLVSFLILTQEQMLLIMTGNGMNWLHFLHYSLLIEYFNMGIDTKNPSPETAKNPMSGKDVDTKEREEHCEIF